MLGGAHAGLAPARGRRVAEGERPRAGTEDRALERATFGGRVLGGIMLVVLGPQAVAPDWPWPFYILGAYFIAYATAMLVAQERAESVRARRDAASLGHLFDLAGFIGGLALGAISPAWLVTNAAPIVIVIAAFRSGPAAAWYAAGAIAVAHVALTWWRAAALGIAFDPVTLPVYLGVYAVAGLVSSGIEGQLATLRARRDLQVAVHEPLVQAHDDMADGILVMEGDRPVYVSDGLLRLTGRDRNEAGVLRSAQDVVAGHPLIPGITQRALARADGSTVDMEVVTRRYRTQGRERMVTIVRDVSLRTRALAELERVERLESLGSLAGGIAHDFNNLLAVILNASRLALTGTDGGGSSRHALEEIRQAAERGTALARQLLELGRGGAVAAKPTDVSGTMRSAERLLRRTLGGDVSLEVVLFGDPPPVSLAPGQLELILVNLAANARDAMPDGGRLSIVIDDVYLDAVTAGTLARLLPGHYTRIRVHDTGVGMAPDVAARAFEPFFTTKPAGEGSGLGLPTVFGVVRRANGHIELSSTQGLGSTFTIHLPAAGRA